MAEAPDNSWPFPDFTGHGVRLVRADASHARALFEATPPETFEYYIRWPREWTLGAFTEWFLVTVNDARSRAYVALDARTGETLGSTSFLDIDPPHRSLEIGGTWYAPQHRGTRVNPACKFLMLSHAFDTLRCQRVTIKCNAKNALSRAAIAKLGATFEGVLRSHRVQQDGRPRDTAYFSILADEWPRVREGLLARLA
jgi:RimJ/RimL family protein N-acetyltransferase